MTKIRKIRTILKCKPTREGAGVHLNRVFGFSEAPMFDPFLLLDDFRSDNPDHYRKGFPWHPHRGIETITYVLQGDVEHGDSLGNNGNIRSGDVQWMTAGSGIIHQEMPKGDENGIMDGFQLWANLPSHKKMMPPRYRDIKSTQIPEISLTNGITVKILAGSLTGTTGPVQDIVIDPEYFDVTLPANTQFTHPTPKGHTVFIYIIAGEVSLDAPVSHSKEGEKSLNPKNTFKAENGTVVLFDDGEHIVVSAGEIRGRFLYISGKPIGEPIAWQGPIVMNSQEELQVAFDESEKGVFTRSAATK